VYITAGMFSLQENISNKDIIVVDSTDDDSDDSVTNADSDEGHHQSNKDGRNSNKLECLFSSSDEGEGNKANNIKDHNEVNHWRSQL